MSDAFTLWEDGGMEENADTDMGMDGLNASTLFCANHPQTRSIQRIKSFHLFFFSPPTGG